MAQRPIDIRARFTYNEEKLKRGNFMYCGRCGNRVDENGFCAVCAGKASAPQKTEEPFVQKQIPKQKKPKTLASCAWFAPVAALCAGGIYFLRGVVYSFLYNILPSEMMVTYFEDGRKVSSLRSVVSMPLELMFVLLTLAVCYVFMYIALKKQPKYLRRTVSLSFLIPYLSLFIVSSLEIGSDIIYNFRGDMYDYARWSLIFKIISFILNALITFVVVRVYYRFVEKRTRSKEARFLEVDN